MKSLFGHLTSKNSIIKYMIKIVTREYIDYTKIRKSWTLYDRVFNRCIGHKYMQKIILACDYVVLHHWFKG